MALPPEFTEEMLRDYHSWMWEWYRKGKKAFRVNGYTESYTADVNYAKGNHSERSCFRAGFLRAALEHAEHKKELDAALRSTDRIIRLIRRD